MKFYNVEELCSNRINKYINLVPSIKNSRVSIAAFYRLLIPQLIPANIEKCIYLDSDILINLDLEELWQIELDDKPLAAVVIVELGGNPNDNIVQEGLIKPEDYFNSGVLLMNLKVLRGEEENIISSVVFRGTKPHYKFFDQTILNYCFAGRILKLPAKFNKFLWVARKEKETFVARKIYHYTAGTLSFEMSDPFNRLWMSYFMRTPWFDVDAIGRLYAGVQQLHVGLKQSMANVSAMMSGKTRAFFVPPQSVDAVKKIFSVRADEEIIPAENQLSLKKLIDSMNASRGKKIFFIVLQGFPFGLLNQLGFVAGRDFVNAMDFLSEAHGFPLNSHNLIKAM